MYAVLAYKYDIDSVTGDIFQFMHTKKWEHLFNNGVVARQCGFCRRIIKKCRFKYTFKKNGMVFIFASAKNIYVKNGVSRQMRNFEYFDFFIQITYLNFTRYVSHLASLICVCVVYMVVIIIII